MTPTQGHLIDRMMTTQHQYARHVMNRKPGDFKVRMTCGHDGRDLVRVQVAIIDAATGKALSAIKYDRIGPRGKLMAYCPKVSA